MEFLIDTIDLDEIASAVDHLPIAGVTSNPSIVKKTAPDNFFDHLKKIRKIIGPFRTLHVQMIGEKAETMVQEAYRILREVDENVYIKIPVTYEGIKAIRILKSEGIKVTATAVYDLMQAYLALEAKADYIAPYVNRIGNLGNDPFILIENLEKRIITDGYGCRILGASFKGVQQIRDTLNCGADAVTAPVSLLNQIFDNPSVHQAVRNFNEDWNSVYEKGILDL